VLVSIDNLKYIVNYY